MYILIPPGKRKKNKYYLIRDTTGAREEQSTGTIDAERANRLLAKINYDLAHGIKAKESKTFPYVVSVYSALHRPSKRDQEFLRVLCTFWYETPVNEIEQDDIVAVANRLYPHAKASTKNRAVMVPTYTILNFAAAKSRKWCDYPEMEKFSEEPVKKRKTDINTAIKLIDAVDGIQKLLLLWLFKHGDRITGTLNIKGSDVHIMVDPEKDYYDRLTGKKKKRWEKAPIDIEVRYALIECYGENLPEGRIFPWRDRWAVYDWLNPLCKRLKIKFTPHVARHSILSWMGDEGGNEIQIKTRGGHASLKSSEPYLASNLQVVRSMTARFKLAGGKKGENK